MVMGSLSQVHEYVVLSPEPENWNAPLVIDIVPLALDVVSVAVH